MALNQPPDLPPDPQPAGGPPMGGPSPPPVPSLDQMSLAQTSAMGTTAGAPVANSMGPPAGSGLPGAGPAPAMPGQNPIPTPGVDSGPPIGPPTPPNPVVAPHAKAKSVGTHASRSAHKRGNPTHGMSK